MHQAPVHGLGMKGPIFSLQGPHILAIHALNIYTRNWVSSQAVKHTPDSGLMGRLAYKLARKDEYISENAVGSGLQMQVTYLRVG